MFLLRRPKCLGLFSALGILLPLWAGVVPVSAQEPASPEFVLTRDAVRPVIILREVPTELLGAPARELRVFSDGHCELEVPAMMRGAGQHEWDVSPEAVEALARQALVAEVDVLDPAQLRANLKTANREDDSLRQVYRFDDDTIEFELNLGRYRAGPSVAWSVLERKVKFVGLRGDRARNPEQVQVRRLLALRDALDAIATDYLEKSGKSP